MSAGWEQLQNQLEHERWLEEHCEHGVPKDSRNVCAECRQNTGSDDPDVQEWQKEYNQYLEEQERMNVTVRTY